MEPYRLWHEPEVIIYGNLVTPGTCSSAEAYDLGNRKWYQLNVNSEVDDDEWMSRIVEEHISKYYQSHGKIPPFNVINVTSDGTFITYETQPDDDVARPITKKLRYDPNDSRFIAISDSGELTDKSYLGRGVDRCMWKNRECVFKRIEFNVDIQAIDREIKVREQLMAVMDKTSSMDQEDLMQQNYHVVPILAVVLHQESDNEVKGILMPFLGPSLSSIFEPEQGSAKSPIQPKDIAITMAQIRDLVLGVREMSSAAIMHGDINERNTLLVSASRKPGRLMLCDLGSVAPDYQSDAVALGELLLWLIGHAPLEGAGPDSLEAAANSLKLTENFDEALQLLGCNE
ncbi:hypothetical protein ONS95_002054 [Cadophora gregata]|uniref:uncharacterized protein n=1 Tax=Cadophora gregata TaxID=51156 RepID=UPI0026DC4890|nr:uncharacterized protein ONS95_002054 [Cadophora gregata]KAK0111711.1 hypothetical protein ONS95_002054 [Cadophora gregata]KAK0111813.1 hypothetical protein ONS96_001081 [Cadophora gregata f. sp. sojae]